MYSQKCCRSRENKKNPFEIMASSKTSLKPSDAEISGVSVASPSLQADALLVKCRVVVPLTNDIQRRVVSGLISRAAGDLRGLVSTLLFDPSYKALRGVAAQGVVSLPDVVRHLEQQLHSAVGDDDGPPAQLFSDTTGPGMMEEVLRHNRMMEEVLRHKGMMEEVLRHKEDQG